MSVLRVMVLADVDVDAIVTIVILALGGLYWLLKKLAEAKDQERQRPARNGKAVQEEDEATRRTIEKSSGSSKAWAPSPTRRPVSRRPGRSRSGRHSGPRHPRGPLRSRSQLTQRRPKRKSNTCSVLRWPRRRRHGRRHSFGRRSALGSWHPDDRPQRRHEPRRCSKTASRSRGSRPCKGPSY